MSRLLVLFVATLFACSGNRMPPPSSREPSSPAPREAPSPVERGGSEQPTIASAPDASSETVALPVTFERVESTKVTSLALGKPPKVAFLAQGQALVFDGEGFVRLPAPDTRDATLSVEIFFGRDDQPRLMGFRRTSERTSTPPYYRRYKAGRFQPEPSELGPLAAPDGALYGVLGHDDPEVVCKPRAFCLVKRTTGWGRAPAHAEPVRVILSGGTAFALHADRIERLERDAWAPLVPERSWAKPRSLVVDAEGTLFVVHGSEVTRLVAGRWESMASPGYEPSAIWATSPSDVWLVGVAGASHFDGNAWRRVPNVTGPLSLIARSGRDLWLAGEAGIFRGTPAKVE